MNIVRIVDHGYLLGAVCLAVYSQTVIRWRLEFVSDVPPGALEKLKFVVVFLLDPWVMSAVLATFFTGVLWILSLTRFELSYAYPWMALIFIVMLFVGGFVFGETFSTARIIGTVLIFIGLILIAWS